MKGKRQPIAGTPDGMRRRRDDRAVPLENVPLDNGGFDDDSFADGPFAERQRSGENGIRSRWERVRVVLALALFPGCPQLYVGRTARGFVWSLLFLIVALPLSFFLFFTWAFSENALFWVLIGLGAFLSLGALGPALQSWRRAPTITDARRQAVAAFAGGLAFLVAAETGWFLYHHFETVAVVSESLEPLISRGEVATILLSRYARPVHGEVILFVRAPDQARQDSEPSLGRVIAKPGDAVSLEQDHVVVNGIEIDFERTDQRRSLEKAGRRLRRGRLVTSLFSPKPDLSAIRDRRVALQGEHWEVILPASSYLVLPDVLPPPGGPGTSGEVELASRRRSPVAWLVDRTDVVGRMIARLW